MKNLTVFVYLPDQLTAVPAGILTYDEQARVGQFSYGRRYRGRGEAVAVDPIALPLHTEAAPGTSLNGGLYGAIRDASPDFWGRLVISTMHRVSITQLDEIDYLKTSNATRVGRLDFRDAPDSPEPTLRAPTFQQLPQLLQAAAAIEARQPVSEDLAQLLEQGTTIGGSRPKCTVEIDQALWIAKFPARNDQFNNARVEYATMTLAQNAGIRVPELRIVPVGQRELLLVKRFDRGRVDGGYVRYGYMSSLSLLQIDETDRHLFSYPAIADQMRVIGCSRAELSEFFARKVFNICCRNVDDHPRNHAFIARAGQYELSPAYDVTPTATAPGVGSEFNLAMNVGEMGRLASIDNARSVYGRFGLTLEQADEIIGRVQGTVAEWRSHFSKSGVSDADMKIFEPSFENPAINPAC